MSGDQIVWGIPLGQMQEALVEHEERGFELQEVLLQPDGNAVMWFSPVAVQAAELPTVPPGYLNLGPRRQPDLLSGDVPEPVFVPYDADPGTVSFERALTQLLNRYTMEGPAANTPDFVLARYLTGCLETWARATKAREDWYGHQHRPGT